MVCDISGVACVVQFKEPSTISCLVQLFDRAALDDSIQGHSVLQVSRRFNKASSRTKKANCKNSTTATVSNND
jgi:hypothetical protein